MRYAVMVEPQRGMTYEQLAGLAQVVEASGFEALHRADHLASFGDGPERDATEAWTTVAGLARETTTLRPGMLVSPITFRHPALVARMATTVDWMSGGRLEVGLGAGTVEQVERDAVAAVVGEEASDRPRNGSVHTREPVPTGCVERVLRGLGREVRRTGER